MVALWAEEQKAEAECKERKRHTFRAKSREMYRRSQVPSDDRELGTIAPLAAEETVEADGELKQPVGRSHWAMEEMIKADLGDKRLNKHLVGILSNLAERPTASIPAACGGHAEMTATYHFFDNPKVTWEKVIQPHQAATRQRMAQQPVVLLVQDTTEIDVTRPQQQVVGSRTAGWTDAAGSVCARDGRIHPRWHAVGRSLVGDLDAGRRRASQNQSGEGARAQGTADRGEREFSLAAGAARGAGDCPGIARDEIRVRGGQRGGHLQDIRRTAR